MLSTFIESILSTIVESEHKKNTDLYLVYRFLLFGFLPYVLINPFPVLYNTVLSPENREKIMRYFGKDIHFYTDKSSYLL